MSDIVERLRREGEDAFHKHYSLGMWGLCAKAADAIEAQAAEIAALREALEWYANPEIYKPHPHGLAFDDRDLSHHARAALQGNSTGSKPKAPLPAMGAGQETGGAALQGNRPKPWDEPPPVAPVPQRPPHQED